MTEVNLDLFDRESFAKELLDDLTCFKTPFSVGLDAKWGNGKTFFVDNFLSVECSKRKIPLIKYDCFEHEREQDTFISLVKVILDSAELLLPENTDEIEQGAFNNACSSAKSFAVGLLKTTAKAVAKHALGQTLEECGENFGITVPGDLHTDLVSYVDEQLKPAKQLKNLRDEFYANMKDLIKSISEKNSIIVVIDELDRCRPNHAVNVLESIKHLMAVPGVFFVFTYHREQLCSALKHVYGSGLDANLYLQKFVDLDIPLPGVGIPRNHDNFEILFKQHLEKTAINQTLKIDILKRVSWYSRLAEIYDFTPRDIHRCLMLEITYERRDRELMTRPTVTLLIVLKVKFGNLERLTSSVSFPLLPDTIAEFKLGNVLQMATSLNHTFSKQLVLDIGYLFLDRDQYGVLEIGYPTSSEIKSRIEDVQRVLGFMNR